jgi:type IV pilus assembly protein PilC
MAAKHTFRYEGLAPDGGTVLGTIDAASEAEGRERLRSLTLSIRAFEPITPIRTTPLNADDLAAFNDQLAQLARAGLPVEQGLKLLAGDMSRGRLRRAVEAVSNDLHRGMTLPQAIDAHRRAFPPLYANVVDAGIRTNNLPAVLFNLSKHLDLTRRIRASVSRAVAYPAMVLLAIVIVSAFLSAYVLPTMMAIFEGEGGSKYLTRMVFRPSRWGPAPPPPTVPMITQVALQFGRVSPYIAAVVIAAVLGSMFVWPFMRGTAIGRSLVDCFLSRLPLFGPPLRFSLIGRWCDAMRIGISAGLDLPDSLSLASRTVGSGRLAADAAQLSNAASTGARLDGVGPLSLLPVAVPAAIEIGVRSGTLSETLDALATLYLRQAESRAKLIPLVLTPLLVFILAVVLGALMTALFSPLTQLLKALTG